MKSMSIIRSNNRAWRVLLIGLWLAPASSWAAVAFDAQCSNGANTATTVSCSITIGAGADRVLYIVAHNDREGGDDINTPTVGGSSTGVTLVDSQAYAFGTDWWQKIYRLTAPASGTVSVAFTTTNATHLAIGAISYSGVDQTTPNRTPSKGTGSDVTPTISVTTTSGDVVAEFFWWRSNNGNRLLTFDGSQASRINQSAFETGIGGSDETSAGASVTASGTIDFATQWMVMGVPLIAASAGGGSTSSFSLMGVGR